MRWKCFYSAVRDQSRLIVEFDAANLAVWIQKADFASSTPCRVCSLETNCSAVQIENGNSSTSFVALFSLMSGVLATKFDYYDGWWTKWFWMRMRWKNIAFGYEYSAEKLVDEQGAEKHVIDSVRSNANLDCNRDTPKTALKKYNFLNMSGVLGNCS